MILTLEEIKDHLKLDSDEQNAELKRLYDAAESYAMKYLGWTTMPEICPAAVKHAMLLVIGDLFENREGVLAGQSYDTNPTVDRLLSMFRENMGL